MKFRTTAVVAILVLSGCASTVPDSNPNAGQGVGFDSYDSYAERRARAERQMRLERAQRDAALEAEMATPVTEERAIAQETLGVLNETSPLSETGSSAIETSTVAVAVADPNNPNISDEQNFDAVAARETIESDRERLQRQQENMQVIQPEAVPERPSGNAAPNIVSYALATTNSVGQPVHRRPSRFNEDRYRRACAEFASPDQAQAAFLAAGGPERDRRRLDPDGDGFACFWDPTPFRAARGG